MLNKLIKKKLFLVTLLKYVVIFGMEVGIVIEIIFKIYTHIVPNRKFDRVGGTSSATFPNFNYVAPREICVERNCFDSPIAK